MRKENLKNLGLNGIRTHDHDTGTVLYQLSYQASWSWSLWNISVEVMR